MAKNPLNLGLRFFLELFGLFAFGYWGWNQYGGWLRVLLSIGLPLIAAGLWGTFRVPDDPGKAPIPVPGLLRLILEAAYFIAATWALVAAGRPDWAWIFGLVVAAHYLLSYDRIAWLLRR
jgi:hypothetical protein